MPARRKASSRREFFGFSERPSGGGEERPRGKQDRGRGDDRREPGDGRDESRPRRAARKPGGKGGKGGGGWGRRWALRLARWSFVAAVRGLLAIGGLIAWYAYDLPELNGIPQLERRPLVTLLAHDGTPFATFGEQIGPPVPVSQMPKHLPQAVLAIEDRRFYGHFGIDPIGLARAAWVNWRTGQLVQGGSTITQQLAKNLFLTSERTFKRKVQEAIVAIWLESRYGKDELLTLYLNRVYLGAGTFGIAAAAERYFGKQVRDLTLTESALLAGLLQAPSRFAPTRNQARADRRADVVLSAMADAGYITPAEAARARAEPIKFARPPERVGRYFADWTVDQATGYIGAITKDVVIRTTLDVRLQRAAEQRLAQLADGPGAKAGVGQGAVVVLSPDGAVRAMAGGVDYADSQFNRATRALRQPGSAFKPFVYAAALEAGLTPDTGFVDAPVVVGDFAPRNFDNGYRGAVTMEQALAHSLNTVAVRALQQVGVDRVMQMAKRLGVTSPLKREAGLALGASEVTLLELTAAYATFANDGAGVWPYGVGEVRDAAGNAIYRRLGSGPGLRLDPRIVAGMNRMLSAVIGYGTGRAADIGRSVYGKTGTTDDYRDAWFVGYSHDYVAGVWLGNDDRTPMKRVTGGGLPAQLWRDVMRAAHDGLPARTLPVAEATPPAAQPSAGRSLWDSLFGAVMGLGGASSSGRQEAAPARRPGVVYEYPTDRGRD